MKRTLLALLFCLVAASAAPPEKLPRVPASFLRTTDPAWQRILATEVSADFRAASVFEAATFIFAKTDANYIIRPGKHGPISTNKTSGIPGIGIPGLDSPQKKEPPPLTVTRKFTRIPFRTALYLLARDTGSTVTWELTASGFARGIIFTSK